MAEKQISPSPVVQPWRMPGATRDVTLHEQLYRYAEDLQQLLEEHRSLEVDYERLHESYVHLDEAKDVFRQLIDSSRDIHLITDQEGIILQSNPAAAAIATPAAMIGCSLDAWLVHGSHADYEKLLALAAIPGGKVSGDWEFRLKPLQSDAPPVMVSVQVLQMQRSGRAQLHWILRDITLLHEKEFETQISSMVFKNTAEGVMITDINGVILAVNPSFSRITGYAAEEAIG